MKAKLRNDGKSCSNSCSRRNQSDPHGLASRAHAGYVEGNDLKEMIQENPGGRTHRHRHLPGDGALVRR